MAVKTLKFRLGMLSLLPHPTYTLSRLKAHPQGVPHGVRFEVLRDEGRQVLLQELDHLEVMAKAQARVVAIDFRLDEFASRLSKVLLILTADNRTNPLYKHYFDVPLSQLTQPVLNVQLETMRKWQVSLSKSPQAALSAMEPELAALITEANAAVAERDNARQANREFRDVGERRQWVDRLNAARKEVYGALAKLPHEGLGLPSDFADQFFLSEPEREEEAEADSVEALKVEVASVGAALARVKARLAKAEAAEADKQHKAAAEARALQEAELAKLNQEAVVLEQKRAALQAQLETMPA